MSSKLDKNLSLSKLRHLLRGLGLRSVKSELAYALGGIMTEACLEASASLAMSNFGMPDELYVDADMLNALKALSKGDD
jgi:hypothetical protein